MFHKPGLSGSSGIQFRRSPMFASDPTEFRSITFGRCLAFLILAVGAELRAAALITSNAASPPRLTQQGVPAVEALREAEVFKPRPPRTIFEVQLALARRAISPGSLDGVMGPQTRAAIRTLQLVERLEPTGIADAATKARLVLTAAPLTTYQITSNDLARLTPIGATWLAKSQQTKLDYSTILELVAERGWAHPSFIRNLNPKIDWSQVAAGTIVTLPNVQFPTPTAFAVSVRIGLADRMLDAFDANTNLLAHFPCSIARLVEKRPVGQLTVDVIATDPSYRFDPDIFPDSAEGRELGRPLIIPPGPNNPVGNAWIGLDKPGYGIHGTPEPENIGRTESRGCFRLANWNALYLARLVQNRTTVIVEP